MIDAVALAWVTSSIAGIVAAGAGAFEGRLDLRALGQIQNGRRRIARGYIRSQLVRLAICVGWLAIGIPVLFDETPTPLNAFTAVLVASNIAMTAAAWLDLRDRRRLQRGA